MIKEKLQKARITLQEMKLKKSGENKYSGFKYYELADFLPQVNKIFYDLKLFSNFSMEMNEATLTVTDWEDNTSEEFTTPVEELELKGCNKIQALGGVHTYLKRYLYLNALEIVENDMFDAKAGAIEEKKKKPNAGFVPDVLKEKTDDLDDTDIYLGLEETIDGQSALKYFLAYKNKVKDKEKFRLAWQEHAKKLEGFNE